MKHARTITTLLLALSALLMTTAIYAQEDEMALPTPPDGSSDLDWFVGEWDVESRLRVNTDPEEWVEETVVSTVSPIIGGWALQETFDGTLQGEVFAGLSIRTYNETLGKWEQRWTDTTGGGFAEYTGEFADGEFIAYSNRSFTSEEDGGPGEDSGLREVFFDIEDDRFSWRLEFTNDGGETWTQIWTLEYTRQGAAE